ncbi:MAG: hypothetical protein ACJAS4_001431 [Bacteriovoracaceae bacterium]|jgi:hypothetical protein
MKNTLKKYLYPTLMVLFVACVNGESPEETSSLIDAGSSGLFMDPTDIVVTNYFSDSAILLDSDGNFKELLYNVENNQEQVVGVNWNPITNEVFLSINGFPDRIMAISAIDGTERTVIQNTQLNGSTFGVAINSDGSILAIESHQIEKFSANGNRVNDGNFPTGTLLNNLSQVNSLSSGGFVVCGYGGDSVATYDENGSQLNIAVSGIAGTTNGYGCDETGAGEVVASWEGTTDTVVIYDNTLGSVLATYNDSGTLSSPRGVEVLENGNILVTDVGYHYLVELEYNVVAGTLTYVRTIGGGLLNYPWQLVEIPTYLP